MYDSCKKLPDFTVCATHLSCLQIDGENDRVLILWPVTIAHKIDQDSPLYDMNPRDILSSQFEVVLTLEGVTEETGNTIQVSSNPESGSSSSSVNKNIEKASQK